MDKIEIILNIDLPLWLMDFLPAPGPTGNLALRRLPFTGGHVVWLKGKNPLSF
jgi:hypothetical protein